MLRRLQPSASLPLVLLAILLVLSLAARVAWIGEPCQSPCTSPGDHLLVFDEAYYVNAARVIDGLSPPPGAHYAQAPPGTDPNAEHPQGAKLIIAGSIELLGDGPLAWRLGSLIFGSLAILGLFVLVRAAGGGRWPALGASALMACDNLVLVHSRIGTLDAYVLAAMVWGVALYLRGRPILAGLALAVGACFKLVAPYALLVLALVEVLRYAAARRDAAAARRDAAGARSVGVRGLRRFGACTVTGTGAFFGLLAVMDRIATPYDDSTGTLITGGPFAHFSHMLSYAAHQTSPHGPQGIASYPWQWLVDYKPIVYLNINPSHPADGLTAIHPTVHFLGMISPPIMLVGIPSLLFAAWRLVGVWRRRVTAIPDSTAAMSDSTAANELPIVGLAWFVGTFVPFELLSLLYSRTSYIYYMVIVMPGIYVSIIYMLLRARRWRLTAMWAFGVLVAAVIMYPFTPLP